MDCARAGPLNLSKSPPTRVVTKKKRLRKRDFSSRQLPRDLFSSRIFPGFKRPPVFSLTCAARRGKSRGEDENDLGNRRAGMRQGHAVRPYDREVRISSLEQRRSVKGGSRQRQREGRVAPGSDVQGTVRANGIHILFGF